MWLIVYGRTKDWLPWVKDQVVCSVLSGIEAVDYKGEIYEKNNIKKYD